MRGHVPTQNRLSVRRNLNWMVYVAPLAVLVSGAAASNCVIAAGTSDCCASLGAGGPNLSRYCGVYPFGNYCNDAITGNVVIQLVTMAPLGKTTAGSAPCACTWNINSCALIGCRWIGTGTGGGVSKWPAGEACDKTGGGGGGR